MNRANLRPVAFVLAATNHGTMLVNRHDYRLIPGGGFGVGHQLLNQSAFDPPEVDFVLQLLECRRKDYGDGVVAIDGGANIGVHTLEWAQFMHGWGEVVAFEAQERLFYALAGNITLNNCFNARAVWAAIGAEDGTIEVPVPDYCVPGSFGSLELRPSENAEFIGQEIDYAGRTSTTRLTTIDALGLSRLDLVKIDIEGMELEALAGAEASLAACRPQLVIEKIKSDEDAIRRFVERLGYRTLPFGLNLLAIHETDPTLARVTAT